jgi:tripartite-type tricarboxylate transporter receptor subunit TctC
MKPTLLLAAVLALGSGLATAQDYPSKPIRVVVPNAAGGATDAAARLYQKALEDILPQPVVVVNMPGAGTTTGSREVQQAVPDGYTMLLIHQALFTSSVMGLIDFGPEAFEPVAMTGVEPTILAVRTDSDITNLDEFYAAARENPGDLKAGVQIGALNHFGMAMVANAGGVELNYVQTGGGGPTYAALLGGHIDAAYGSVPDLAQYIEADQMRSVAVLSENRASSLPDAQTAAEQGYDVVLPIRHVWYMPKGTPADIVATMEDALRQALDSETVREFYAARSVEPVIVTGDELQQQVTAEFAAFQEIEATMQ